MREFFRVNLDKEKFIRSLFLWPLHQTFFQDTQTQILKRVEGSLRINEFDWAQCVPGSLRLGHGFGMLKGVRWGASLAKS